MMSATHPTDPDESSCSSSGVLTPSAFLPSDERPSRGWMLLRDGSLPADVGAALRPLLPLPELPAADQPPAGAGRTAPGAKRVDAYCTAKCRPTSSAIGSRFL